MKPCPIVTLIVLLAAAAPAATPSLVFDTPQEGKSYPRATIMVSVRIVDGPDQPLVVKVESAGLTHRVVANRRPTRALRPGEKPDAVAHDGYWFMPAGTHSVTVSVWRHGADQPLIAPQTVTFTVTAPPPKDLESRAEFARQKIADGAAALKEARRKYERAVWQNQRQPNAASLRTAANHYLFVRNEELTRRIQAYCDLSSGVYEAAGNAGDALRALKTAENYFAAEGMTLPGSGLPPLPAMYLPEARAGVPAHFWAFAFFYLRRNALDLATAWIQKASEWYVAQAAALAARPNDRQACLVSAAGALRQIGDWHVTLANDSEAQARWNKKADSLSAPGTTTSPRGIDLLDTR